MLRQRLTGVAGGPLRFCLVAPPRALLPQVRCTTRVPPPGAERRGAFTCNSHFASAPPPSVSSHNAAPLLFVPSGWPHRPTQPRSHARRSTYTCVVLCLLLPHALPVRCISRLTLGLHSKIRFRLCAIETYSWPRADLHPLAKKRTDKACFRRKAAIHLMMAS